jgi:hypothetical protein
VQRPGLKPFLCFLGVYCGTEVPPLQGQGKGQGKGKATANARARTSNGKSFNAKGAKGATFREGEHATASAAAGWIQGPSATNYLQDQTRDSRGSHGKDGKQKTFPTFPRHGCGDLYETKEKFCCTWILSASRFPAGMTERTAKAKAKATATAKASASASNSQCGDLSTAAQKRAFGRDDRV